MEREEYREKIDEIDDQIVELFIDRMNISAELAGLKKESDMPVVDARREQEIIQKVTEISPENLQDYTPLLYYLILEISKSYQQRLINKSTALTDKIDAAIEDTPKLFPKRATVACQGIEGANSHLAATRLFDNPNIFFFSSFESVFSSIEQGLCKYGVLPLENSNAGSVNAVYDLMMKGRFSIVRSLRQKIDHCLLAKKQIDLEDIKEIYTHEQAISQCSHFLKGLNNAKAIPVENTAVAAEMVATSDREDIAALAAKPCAKYYNLKCLQESVQNRNDNYTRFICISKDLEIYPGADRTSLMATLPHEPGALYKLLARLYALNINLNKLESRPIPDKEFEFMFYFDLDVPVYSPEFKQLIAELPNACEKFNYFGSYSEVI